MDFRAYVRAHLPPLAIAREPEIVDELAQHMADLYQEARSAGFDHETALARATAALPDAPDTFANDLESASRALPGLIVDRWHAAHETPPSRSGNWSMTDMRRDLRIAIRSLRRTSGFTAVVVLTLAIGIGATTAIYSVVDAVLINPLPYPRPGARPEPRALAGTLRRRPRGRRRHRLGERAAVRNCRVMPREFSAIHTAQAWAPLSPSGPLAGLMESRTALWLDVIGVVTRGVAAESAHAEMSASWAGSPSSIQVRMTVRAFCSNPEGDGGWGRALDAVAARRRGRARAAEIRGDLPPQRGCQHQTAQHSARD